MFLCIWNFITFNWYLIEAFSDTMTVQIYRKLVKFLTLFPYMALSSQGNAFKLIKILGFLWLFYKTDIIFKLCTKIKSLFNFFFFFFFTENVSLQTWLYLQKKIKIDILVQSKRFK